MPITMSGATPSPAPAPIPAAPSPSRAEVGSSAEQAAVEAIHNASSAAETIAAQTTAAAVGGIQLPDFGNAAAGPAEAVGLGLLDDVTLRVRVELGRTQIYIEDVLRLNSNSVVELDKAANDPVDIFVNERHVARGEILVLNDHFCVRISEIIQPADT